jgi:hypothetical protein
VRRFANRVEYLAWLLGELLAGRSWSGLHTREFEGLRALPLDGLMVAALLREPEKAELILMALSRCGYLNRLLPMVSAAAATRILEACAPARDSSAVDRVLWRMVAAGAASMNALGLYLRCHMEAPVREAVEACLALRRVLANVALREALASGNFSRALRLCTDPTARRALLLAHELAAGDGDWLREAVRALVPEADGVAGDLFESQFGGVLLLVTDLSALYPKASSLFRYAVLLRCMGRDGTVSAWRDPALLLASGIDEHPTLDELRAFRSETAITEDAGEELAWFSLSRLLGSEDDDLAGAHAALLLMRRFARRFMRLEHAGAAYLYHNIVAGAATITRSEDAVLVRLRPRPLQIVMQMAGINGWRVAAAWLQSNEGIPREIVIELSYE